MLTNYPFFFSVGLGACGWTNVDSDYIVALQTESFDSGAHCGKVCNIFIRLFNYLIRVLVRKFQSLPKAGRLLKQL